MFKFILMIFIAIPLALFADGVIPIGEGTDQNPYLVETLDNLLWITTTQESWDKHFLQTADIDASETVNWYDGLGFLPISSSYNTPFSGNYDGDNHQISNLYINRPLESEIGIFRYVVNGEVSNLTLTDVNIIGVNSYRIAPLVGYLSNSYIVNCHSSGVITNGNGLVGRTHESTLEACSSSVNVTSVSSCGGLTNSILSSFILNCSSSSTIISESSAAGLCITTNSSSEIIDSYFEGTISAPTSEGLAFNAVLLNSFYDYETVLMNGEHYITRGAIPSSLYNEWVNNDFQLSADDYLQSDTDGYIISDLEDFKKLLFFGQFNLNFILESNIDLADLDNFYIPYFTGMFDGNNYIISNLFCDNFIESGVGLFGLVRDATITNITLNNFEIRSKSYSGLLSSTIMNSTIENCTVQGAISGGMGLGGISGTIKDSDIVSNNLEISIQSDGRSGGIAGSVSNSLIDKCELQIEINIHSDSYQHRFGGLVGSLSSNSKILNSNCNITIVDEGNSGPDYVGGLVGYVSESEILNSSSSGSISTSGSNVGGLVGYFNQDGVIRNSYSSCSVNGRDSVGGFIGGAFSFSAIVNSYSYGEVTFSHGNSGGFIGGDGGPYTLNCFWDVESSGVTNSVVGTPKTTAEMHDIATYTAITPEYYAWDFVGNENNDTGIEDYWTFDPEENNGYPIFYNALVGNESDTESVSPANNSYNLHNYPNPFNPETSLSFDLRSNGLIKLDIYNIKGQKVKRLINEEMAVGTHSIVWNGTNNQNQAVASGVYFYKLTTSERTETKKMLLMK